MFNNEYFNKEQDFSFKSLFVPFTTKKASIIITILGFIVFGNALFNGFVCDDFPFILNNPVAHSFNIARIFSKNIFNTAGYYRPIPALYFTSLYNMFGSQAFFYHFLQVSLHILNTIFLFLTLQTLLSRNNNKETIEPRLEEKEWNKLSRKQKRKYQRMNNKLYNAAAKASLIPDLKINLLSFFISLIFLVHPINVESVSYIASSQSELLFLFGILALLISRKEKFSLKPLLLLSGLTLLSLLTKETGFLFLVMILFFQYFFNRKKLLEFVFFEITSLATYLLIRFAIGGVLFSKIIIVEPIPLASLSFLERLANIPIIVLYYLTTTFFPLRLALDQKWLLMKLTVQNFYLPLLLDSLFFLALCISGVYIYKYKRNFFKEYLFFFLWFVFGLLLLLQIFPLDMTVADRWFYFPLVGLLGMLGVGVQIILFSQDKQGHTLINYKKARMSVALFGAVLILLLSLRTIIRNKDYHDEITLATHDSHIEDNFILEDTLGVDYAKAGNREAAFPHLQKSVKLYPYAANFFHLGLFYETGGNVQKAKEYYLKAYNAAVTSSSTAYSHALVDYQIYPRLAKMLLLSNEYETAEKISKKGLQYDHNNYFLMVELALSENKLHHWNDAQATLMQLKPPSPNDPLNILYQITTNNQEIPTDAMSM